MLLITATEDVYDPADTVCMLRVYEFVSAATVGAAAQLLGMQVSDTLEQKMATETWRCKGETPITNLYAQDQTAELKGLSQ